MLRKLLLVNILLCSVVLSKRRQKDKEYSEHEDLGGTLITSLRNDANLDLSMDEDYEDLRAELLAYHTALASLTKDTVNVETSGVVAPQSRPAKIPNGRRSMKTTPCWQMGGICIPFKLCQGYRFLSEVPGCKNKLEVCCFSWNKFDLRDFKDDGISNIMLPWSNQKEFGGQGIISKYDSDTNNENKNINPRVLQAFEVTDRQYSKENNTFISRMRHKNYNHKPHLHKSYVDNKKSPVLVVLEIKK